MTALDEFGSDVMELKYNRLFLGFAGSFFVMMGVAVCMLLIGSDALLNARVARVFVAILGETGALIVLFAAGILTAGMGVRLLMLLGEGAAAVRATARGIEMRSLFHSGLLKWSDIRSIGLAPMPMAPNKSGLKIEPKHKFNAALRYLTLSESITIGCQILKANEAQVEEWITHAIEQSAQPARRSSPPQSAAENPIQSAPAQRPSFGRKVV